MRRRRSRPARGSAWWGATDPARPRCSAQSRASSAPSKASITTAKRARIGRLAQEAPDGPQSLFDVVLAADAERTALLAAAEQEHDAHRLADVHTRLADIAAHAAPARAAGILAGLGFSAARAAAAVRVVLRRLAHARRAGVAPVLRAGPAAAGRADQLPRPRGHAVAAGLPRALSPHGAGDQPRPRPARQRGRRISSTSRAASSRSIAATTRRSRASIASARRSTSSVRATRRRNASASRRSWRASAPRRPRRARRSRASSCSPGSNRSRRSSTRRCAISTSRRRPSRCRRRSSRSRTWRSATTGEPVLRRLNLRIDDDDRIALIGANGNGKSTFAKLLAERMTPLEGRITRADKLDVAYFAQHQLDELKANESPYDHIRALMPDAPEAKVRARVGSDRVFRRGGRRQGRDAVGRREGAPHARHGDVRRPAPRHPRRAHQPPRHRQPRRPDRGDQRVCGRGGADLARPPPDRGLRGPAVAGRRAAPSRRSTATSTTTAAWSCPTAGRPSGHDGGPRDDASNRAFAPGDPPGRGGETRRACATAAADQARRSRDRAADQGARPPRRGARGTGSLCRSRQGFRSRQGPRRRGRALEAAETDWLTASTEYENAMAVDG